MPSPNVALCNLGPGQTATIVDATGSPVQLQGGTAPAPPSTANVDSYVLSFAFDTASPLVVASVLAGQTVLRCAVVVVTPFDDPAATLQLGTPFSPALLLAAGDVLPGQLGQYENDALAQFAGADTVPSREHPPQARDRCSSSTSRRLSPKCRRRLKTRTAFARLARSKQRRTAFRPSGPFPSRIREPAPMSCFLAGMGTSQTSSRAARSTRPC
jgi:hypothetical protein